MIVPTFRSLVLEEIETSRKDEKDSVNESARCYRKPRAAKRMWKISDARFIFYRRCSSDTWLNNNSATFRRESRLGGYTGLGSLGRV